LKNNHNTASNVWGIIHVEKGQLQYIIAPDEYIKVEQNYIISKGEYGLIKPQCYHRVAAIDNQPYEFHVEFNKE